ncbi:sulfatase family protein [Pelagicoccus mobilis]|uniref:Sulfatase n=1 Tax=Pelagicoccus mobilis TaxID=415221 RepID=A0A934VJR1_9BACT|nr:sulfatase [Pelagicoccus mobilis]MBK1875886.1 sulfatase [Pelagicoccus mobilis]
MMKRIFQLLLSLVLLPVLYAGQPNFIVFLTDDQGYNDVGCYGAPNLKTPNFDRLAEEGVRFTSAYSAAPLCGPSRSALMTGSYPIRIGEPGNTKGLHTIPHTKELMIPEVLREVGYTSAIIGKWHAGETKTQGDPLSQGFDYFFGTPKYNGNTKLITDTKLRTSVMRNREVFIETVEQEEMNQLTTMYTEESIRFITENQDKPFFLYLAHNMPHTPLGVSDKFRGKSAGGLYGDVIEELDWSLGQILNTLEELDLDENTVLVFVSDNGPWIHEKIGDHAGSADPLRGAKAMSWEGGSRVPCIIRWPNIIQAGQTSDALITLMDLLPTFSALSGSDLPGELRIDGKDLTPLLTGTVVESPHKYFYYYCYTQLHAVRDAKWKLVLPRVAKPKWMKWRRLSIDAVKEIELYDLESDIGETTNVASMYPEVVDRLLRQVESARSELGDCDRIGSAARFYDSAPKRPGILEYKDWAASRKGEKL